MTAPPDTRPSRDHAAGRPGPDHPDRPGDRARDRAGDRARDRPDPGGGHAGDHAGDHGDDAATVLASTRDPDVFAVIFDRYYPEIRSYVARRLSAEVADDVAANAFLAAFRKRGHYDAGQGNVRAWLYGFATREVGTHRRTELRRYRMLARLGAQPDPRPAGDGAADPVTGAELDGRLAAALAGLSAKDRDVLLLVALAELSYDEVAEALAVPYGTVCSRLNRARRQLRAALGATCTPTDQKGHTGG
jgi:RNA polymerase sigma-70 factor, ECF subfamily